MNDKHRQSIQSYEQQRDDVGRRQRIVPAGRYNFQLELIVGSSEVSQLAIQEAQQQLRKLDLITADALDNDRPHTYHSASLESSDIKPAKINVPEIATSPAKQLTAKDVEDMQWLYGVRTEVKAAIADQEAQAQRKLTKDDYGLSA